MKFFDAEERQKREEGILMASFGATDETLENVRSIVRMVFDENGEMIEKLPGKSTLEEFGLETYKKQFRAAMKGSFARLLRRGLDRLLSKEDTRQQMLNHSHAMKQELGNDWKIFYSNLLTGKNQEGVYENILTHLLQQGIIKEPCENESNEDESYITELDRKTGRIFNKYPLPIYEIEVHQRTKQALANDGGLYKIILEIRPDEFATFFAKKHGKKAEYERTLRVQPLLAEITEKVGPIIARDNHNQITVEPYINGETLTQRLRRTSMNTEHSFIQDPVQREKQTRQTIELNDQNKKEMLIPALDELVDISNTVEENRKRFGFLPTIGKGGESFTDCFKKKYRSHDADLIALVEKNITSYMDAEDTVFCHGDEHTDNVIERLHKPNWIDWEYARFSIPQTGDAKFLKKTSLSREAEDEVVRHSCMKRGYDQGYKRYRMVYDKSKIFDFLLSAAKYHNLSFDSRKQRAEKQAQADVYFTDALRLIETDKTIDERERFRLSKALERDARGRLSRLASEEYEKIAAELDPYKDQSIENLGTPSIMEKYSRPPLAERLGKLWRKHKLKLAAGVLITIAGLVGAKVRGDNLAYEARVRTKFERINQHYTDIERNEKLMPFVSEYATKYDNVSETELASVINAAFNYNKQIIEELGDAKKYPEYPIRDIVRKTRRELNIMQKGLSERQAFVKKEHLENPENNVYSAAKRLHDMKEIFENIEDVYLAFFTSPEFVKKWKEKASNYWDYSKDPEFERDAMFPHGFKKLTDMAIAYTPQNEKD